MNRQRPPIYQIGNRSYLIDTNRPQLRAIKEGKIDFHALSHGHYPGQVLTRRDLSGLSTIGYWDAIGAQDWGEEAHRNEGVEIHLLETGAMPLVVDGKRYHLRAGDMKITRPWQLHHLGAPHIGPGRINWFVLDVGVRRPDQEWQWPAWVNLTREDLAELTVRLRHNEDPVRRSTPEIRHHFRRIAEAIRMNRGRTHLSHIAVHVSHLLLSLLEFLRAGKATGNPYLSTSRRTVELFLTDLRLNPASLGRPWTLQGMAGHCGVGTTLFARHCRELVNTSPARYLLHSRLDLAARRLRAEPGIPITTIALECGFSASQYFASRFRRRFGTTPRDYRSGRQGRGLRPPGR